MRKLSVIWIIAVILAPFGGQSSFAAEEFYLIDQRETPGKILQLLQVSWSSKPVLKSVYKRPSEYIHTIAFHKHREAYFVDSSHRNIYVTNGITEKRIFSFATLSLLKKKDLNGYSLIKERDGEDIEKACWKV